MPGDLIKGRTALITGAAQGVGKCVAEVLARQGAAVVIADIQVSLGQVVARSICESGGKALFVRSDLRREKDIRGMVDFTAKRLRRLDIFVHSARPKLHQVSFEKGFQDWNLAMDVLLKAPALAIKYALKYLRRSRHASVVNIISTNAFFISHQPLAYHVAKAGVLQLTRYLAHELGPQGIRVNAICPGLVDQDGRGRVPLTADPVHKALTEMIVPLQRASSAEEIAETVLFLCTDKAGYVTGQALTVDGGVTLGDHFSMATKVFRKSSDSKIRLRR